ncbi:MAG: hypothetical protein EXS16_09740 [Gemmataceae bacterium]|nr:hypothetical protein [Gemmataceae bacterium]
MATLTVEITDDLNERLDREIAAGWFGNRNDLVQAALTEFMRAQWKANAERLIGEALDEVERGEVTPWQPGDCLKHGLEYLKEKRAREGKS